MIPGARIRVVLIREKNLNMIAFSNLEVRSKH